MRNVLSHEVTVLDNIFSMNIKGKRWRLYQIGSHGNCHVENKAFQAYAVGLVIYVGAEVILCSPFLMFHPLTCGISFF